MANKTGIKKCSTLLKGENKIAQNLQLSLERDILRLFQDSLYCDIKLTVDSSSVLTHSCILRTRASRFYKFIYSEFEFLEQNGISVFTIYNASFTYLQTFVENIYTNIHSPHAEDCIIKHLQETQFLDRNKLGPGTETSKSGLTPESDLFFTPKCSPSELQKPFAPSKLRLKDNNVASYYKIVSVDDIPVESEKEERAFEKELAEQDELLSSFKTIFSKKNKGKTNSLPTGGNSSLSVKKTKPKFNRKFESNVLLYDDQGKYRLPQWKPLRDSGLKTGKKKPEEKLESGPSREENSDMDVSTTGGDSGLDNSSICQPEISPRETTTASETSGVDLTEAAINEEIPNDETTKLSTGSSVSSEAGTWDGTDDFKSKPMEGSYHLNEEEMTRLDEMEKNIRDCEIFLYMERQSSNCQSGNQYAGEIAEDSQGEADRRRNNDEGENYYNYCGERNASDGIKDNCAGASGEIINAKYEYFAQPDILRDVVQETKTPPCTPKKTKTDQPVEEEEEEEPETKPKTQENTSTGVSNYFIDASSLLDEDEIISPPISLINFKPVQGCEETIENGEEKEEEEERKTVVTNFYSAEDQKENERRQGDIIFKNSIPHFSKHEVEESTERLRGGADRFSCEVVEDDSEQVVPSADISPTNTLVARVEESYPTGGGSGYFEGTSLEYESESPEEDHRETVRESQCLSSSVASGSPNLRRNEHAPIISGGMDFVEEEKEKKVQRKPNQSQGEAWVVTFDDNRKVRTRLSSSGTGSDSGRENGEVVRRRNDPPVEFYVKKPVEEVKTEAPQPYPVEKSSSFGYFLDFGKEVEEIPAEQPEEKTEKKNNMFSMFIGMDDNSNSTFSKKPKPSLEREGTFSKSFEESPKEPPPADDVKKSFYMFIESDSPSVKRKQIPKRLNRSSTEGEPPRNNYLRSESYTIDEQQPKSEFECSSSDNSLPYVDGTGKSTRTRGRLPLPLSKIRASHEPKFTAWSETKNPPNEETVSSESWLRTKDIQVNYKERQDEYKDTGYLRKDSTFVRGKPPERDSGVVLCEKGDDSFVKLSDLDGRGKQQQQQQQVSSRMSQSISEGSRKSVPEEVPLSKSIEGGKVSSRGPNDRQINKSLSRLFPNLSAQSLASIGRKDGPMEADVQALETSEVSSSMQSSVEPSGLEISTSETDVSSHVGTTSRLGEDLLKMFLEEISPDVVIDVGGRRIKAHKCILSSRCQYFAAMLSGGRVESAGNVIFLQGFSYNAVHFALRHIYSGESRIPESLNIVELATLADMLCLDGLQEIISYNLKVKYCHSFHVPCSICSVGVIDCLPVTAAYGLDDLYRKCLRWITKYFVKIWPTKTFGSLPKELLEKCYQHQVVHMTVDNVLDTIVNIDKVRGSLPNVRWAEAVSRLVNKLHDASVKYIAEHFSSILTSDNFLALGKEAGWNVSRLEDSLIETIRYLPPEQACWSHARLHRILSVATGPDPPPEMNWNENFLKLLQVIAELVENSLIKQAPRAARSKAWKQMEPELRSRIQEAACLVLPDQEPTSGYRRSNYLKKDLSQPNIPQTLKSRNFEIRQIKLAMSQQATRVPNSNRPLSLQIDQRPKKDSRFIPLRPSVSTSSVRKTEPMEGIRKTQSRSQILGSTISEPKKTVNPRYSEVKSRYLEPRSPQKTATDKPSADSNQRRTFRCVSSSDSSRNCSPALRSSNSRSSIPQVKKTTLATTRQQRNSVLRSESTSTLESKRDRSFMSTRSDTASGRTLSRLTGDENMSTDSLCTDSLLSEKEATIRRRQGKENFEERRNIVSSSSNSPTTRRQNLAGSKPVKTTGKTPSETKSNPPKRLAGKVPMGNVTKTTPSKTTLSSPRPTTTTTLRNQRNLSKTDSNLVKGNSNRRRSEVDSENNKKNTKEPSGVSRSGTFLKDEPTILKKPPQVESEA